MNLSPPPANPIWDLLTELSQSVAFFSGDFSAFSRELCTGIQRQLQLSRAAVWLIDTDQRLLRNSCEKCPSPVPNCQIAHLSLDTARPLLNVLIQRRSLAVAEVEPHFKTEELWQAYLAPHQVKSLTAALIRSGPDIVGVLILEQHHQTRSWTPEEGKLTTLLADLLGHVYTLAERNRIENLMAQHNQELEESVETRTKDLEDVLDNQKALLRGLCHDIANSLNVISATCELIMRKGEIRYVERAQQAVEMMSEMLKQTRSYCLFTDHSHRMHAQPAHQSFALAEAVDKALFILSDKARAKNVKLKVVSEIPASLLVVGDPLTFLHSVIGNVLSNAIKFTPEDAEVHLRLVGNQEFAGIAIRDHGLGMTSEKIKELQTATRKVRSELGTAQESGTGYGIVQVRHYLHQFGGNLTIESWTTATADRPTGTEMTLWLALATPAAQKAA
ncbi:MAG: GAF domain-containing sensor histidine kinase [Bdellovibrionales bacterium]|nr:GAF domain-containing sensor histidine kinase [Bdellovibrionales bacterium]